MSALESKTAERVVVFIGSGKTITTCETGNIYRTAFSMSKESGHDEYSQEHFLGFDLDYICTTHNTKHAWIYEDEHTGKKLTTFVNFDELRVIDKELKGQLLYVLPIDVDDGLESIIQKVGISEVKSWFDNDESFISVFYGIHAFFGNDPFDYIL